MSYKYKILILFSFVFLFQTTNAQNTKDYYQALFLLKFIKYTNWTNQPQYYSIGIVGNSPVIPYLKSLIKNKRINGKPVILSKVSSYSNIDKYSLLYIPKSQNSKFRVISSITKNKSVLIVTEDSRLIYYKAAISFYERNKTLLFHINPKVISERKMQVSNRLLAVGHIVKK
ncbi:MAG: YfiR family protein [Bacteroidales bacterium]|nr:YfiR family protein [Bacteroidales bacterium]